MSCDRGQCWEWTTKKMSLKFSVQKTQFIDNHELQIFTLVDCIRDPVLIYFVNTWVLKSTYRVLACDVKRPCWKTTTNCQCSTEYEINKSSFHYMRFSSNTASDANTIFDPKISNSPTNEWTVGFSISNLNISNV